MAGSISKFPPWLTKRLGQPGKAEGVLSVLRREHLETVCGNARCPNQMECYAAGTATFMILGNICTRNCRFCAVASGAPQPPQGDEPLRVARAVRTLGLSHAVVTSVTRDDLPDQGSRHFAQTIARIREISPNTTVEVLTPDFGGRRELIASVVEAQPDVFNHNVETVPRLYGTVRPQADYARSLSVLAAARDSDDGIVVKSGIMVGLGETRSEIVEVMQDLLTSGCSILTMGQYLSPSREHLPVARFVPPDVFAWYGEKATTLGFKAVSADPFVRSSYKAGELLTKARSSICSCTPGAGLTASP